MEYSSTFNGWFGKISEGFTYENVYYTGVALAKYYKKNSTSGQKLIIGYDPRLFAREFAEFLACIMAENGVKVFLSNKTAPSSVLVVSALHKKSMGALSITGDSHDYHFLGIRAFDKKGFSMKKEDIDEYFPNKTNKKEFEYSLKKWMAKGFVEPFDPTICYIQHIEQMIDFNHVVATNRILFNPNHGSGTYYFDDLLSEKGVRGYTIDGETVVDPKGVELNNAFHISKLYDDMVFHGVDFGFTISPDCSHFQFLIEPHQLKVKEILYLLLELFISKGKKGKILLSDSHAINLPSFAKKHFDITYVNEVNFQNEMKNNTYLISIDAFDRFYFESHGAHDALLCGYYLIEMLNHKDLTPKLLHQKLNKIKGVH